MSHIPINIKNNGMEILAKIMNSFAMKYDCAFKFRNDKIVFIGDEACKPHLIKEIAAIMESTAHRPSDRWACNLG